MNLPIAIAGLVALVAIQNPPGQIFRSGVELLRISVTVTDAAGRAVSSLGKDEFVLTEDEQPREIAFFTRDEQTPLSIMLVVDTSGSMDDKIENVEDALRHFVSTTREEDEIGLLRFASSIERMAPLGSPRNRLERAFRDFRAQGGTSLYDAVIEGLADLRNGRHPKRILLLLTDGDDTSSRATRSDATKAAVRSEALVYALGLGHGGRGSFGHDPDAVDIRTLRTIAEPTGGRAELLEDPHAGGIDRVDAAVAGIVRELRDQYTLGFYPGPTDGRERRIRVTLRNHAYTVRSRTVYSAPAAPR